MATDERSDNEEEEEGEEEERTGDKSAAVAVAHGTDPKERMNGNPDAKRGIENETGMQKDKPAVFLNGKAISGEAHPEGIIQRRKRL